jgi:hypothetical protein
MMELKDMSNEELVHSFGTMAKYGDVDKWDETVSELLRRYDNLKCCGNCKLDKDCTNWANYCDKWVSDGMTRKEREG